MPLIATVWVSYITTGQLVGSMSPLPLSLPRFPARALPGYTLSLGWRSLSLAFRFLLLFFIPQIQSCCLMPSTIWFCFLSKTSRPEVCLGTRSSFPLLTCPRGDPDTNLLHPPTTQFPRPPSKLSALFAGLCLTELCLHPSNGTIIEARS